MSNLVWVTWKDPTTGQQCCSKVGNLEDLADIDDLRKAFVSEQKLEIGPAMVEVRESENGDEVEEDKPLEVYFVKKNKEENNLPGRSRANALFLKPRVPDAPVSNPTMAHELQLLKDRQRKLEFQVMQTSMRLAAYNDDVLSNAFDTATVVPSFWLPTLQQSQSWSGLVTEGGSTAACNWELYKVRDATRKANTCIQGIIDKLQMSFPEESLYTMKKTAGGWEKMTQDATLFLRGRSEVHTMVAALFEWVGQDESPFPSKRHKAKFVRDCVRLYEKCGGHREVHGAISDLSRILAVRFEGLDTDGNLRLGKTPVYEGDYVKTMLTQFAFAAPAHLGFERLSNAHWTFDGEVFDGDRILGEGLHGSVFSVKKSGEPHRYFVKTFMNQVDCRREFHALQQLNQHTPEVPSVPQLVGISAEETEILAYPVCFPLEELRGKLLAWKMAAKMVSCLEIVHQAGLCHRDVRPGNMGFTSRNDGSIDLDVVLFDWASSCDLGAQNFSGTLHYAADAVLEQLTDFNDPVARAVHDLESLVKCFWDITRRPMERPRAVTIETTNTIRFLHAGARSILQAWQEESQSHPLLQKLLLMARAENYEALCREFGNLHG